MTDLYDEIGLGLPNPDKIPQPGPTLREAAHASGDVSIERGARAQSLLENDLLKEAIEELRKTYRRGWERSAEEDIETRERCYRQLRALDDVVSQLQSFVMTGRMTAGA